MNRFPIGRTPRGFVRINSGGRGIRSESHTYVYDLSTGGSIITRGYSWFNLWENPGFDFRNLTIWFVFDNSIKNHQNLINRFDFWNRRTLIMMKFYFLVKFSVEMTHLSMQCHHIWIIIENFHWKSELIRSVFFVNFSRPREQTFSVKNHTELLNSIWFVFLPIGFSNFDLIITLRNVDWYWETYLYIHFKLI